MQYQKFPTTIAVVAFLLAASAFAQTDPNQKTDSPFLTGGIHNCRFWNSMTESSHFAFILGFYQAAALLTNSVDHLVFGASYFEMSDGVSDVCKAPENARVWIADAFEAFRKKQTGTAHDAVERFLEIARTAVAKIEP